MLRDSSHPNPDARLLAGQAREVGGQALQPEGPGESHAPGLDAGPETAVLRLGRQGEFSRSEEWEQVRCI